EIAPRGVQVGKRPAPHRPGRAHVHTAHRRVRAGRRAGLRGDVPGDDEPLQYLPGDRQLRLLPGGPGRPGPGRPAPPRPAAAGAAPVEDLAVIGVDHTLRMCVKPVRQAIKMPAPAKMVRMKLKRGRDLLMTPDHLCYVMQEGRLQTRRADQLTLEDSIPIATSWEELIDEHVETTNLIAARQETLSDAQITSLEVVPYTRDFVYCFEVPGDPPAFFVEGGVLTHNCFGYQGYKNARFGQIEAHECTTALGREMLLRAKDVAESQGYTMLHALVDSVWLTRSGATRADYEALAQTIVRATDLPIAVEGVYRWIAFVPSRTHPLVGVPNRYFGVFEDGTEKVRGLELRRGDAPPIVAAVQRRRLDL